MPKGKPKTIYALIEQGLEDECITLLKEYGRNKVEELQKDKSIWHLAVMNNSKSLITFLLDTQYNNIEWLENSITPWCLAVTVGNAEIAKMLAQRGANTNFKLNEHGNTIFHKAVAETDLKLLQNCIACEVNSELVDAKGYTAHYYAHLSKNKRLNEALQKLKKAENANVIDLHNSVKNDDSEALHVLLNAGVSPILRNGSKSTLLDHALIHKSTKVEAILRAAGISKALTDLELNERRRKIYSKKPNPLLTTYAMDKSSLKRSKFKILPQYLMAISLFFTLCTSLVAPVLLSIGVGLLSGFIYFAYAGALHIRNIKHEKTLKATYKKALDLKRVEVLKLAEQINTEKNAELLEKLASEFKEASEPTFVTNDNGDRKITTGKLLLIDKQIEQLKSVEIEVPESARAKNRAQI